MTYNYIIQNLQCNKPVFKELLTGLRKSEYLWKPKPDMWCLLEIVCHLYDEEREDFRARTRQVLKSPNESLPSIDPQNWVEDRKYINQNYKLMVEKFLDERTASVEWLQSLSSPNWENAYDHPKLGQMSAKLFLSNWLAHDYLHIRQILAIKFKYLQQLSDENLTYAGNL